MIWLEILFWAAIAFGFVAAWWIWRIAGALDGIERDPLWRGCTGDDGGVR